MPYLPLKLPPGMSRPGTIYSARGRWYDGNLVRFRSEIVQPWGGWVVARASTGSGTRNAKPIRGMFGLRTDTATNTRRLFFGTYQKAFVFHEDNTLWDITPSGFTTGAQHATSPGEASAWSFDVIGNNIIACSRPDGLIYTQAYTSPTTALAQLSGSPSYVNALVVTPEKFIFALGANAFPRRVTWSDQDDFTDWTPTDTNQAGDFDVPGSGWLMCGARGRGETLLWTDEDLYAAVYVGGDFVYSFQPRGFQCGIISRRAGSVIDGKAIWMGNNRRFYTYDGFVRPLECEVQNYVFGRLNWDQRSKVACIPNTEFGEVTWVYPGSGTSNAECDSYVTYNYVLGCWYVGAIARTDGIDKSFFDYAYMGGASGALYGHESGTTYAEEDASTLTPYIESGPIQLGEGDRLMMARHYVPDEKTTGDVNLTLYTKMYPTGSETSSGPYTGATPTSVRLTAREMRAKFTQVSAGWRLGTPTLEVVDGPGR